MPASPTLAPCSLTLDEVDLLHVKRAIEQPFRISAGVVYDRQFIILRGRGNGGITCYSEANIDATPYYTGETIQTVWHIARDILLPPILGRTFQHIDEVRATWAGVRGHNFAKAAIEHLFWDLQGKTQNTSIRQMLGGTLDWVEMGTSHSIFETTDELVHDIQQALDWGIKRIKIKTKPGWDDKPLQAVRDAFGDIPLLIDANAAYELDKHGEHLASLDRFNLIMAEQPLPEHDIVDHAELKKIMRTPLCMDESAHDLHSVQSALKIGAVDIVNIKVGRVGGLTVARQIHDHCLARQIPVWVGRRTGTTITIASELAVSSLPGCTYPNDMAYGVLQEKLDHVTDPDQFQIKGDRIRVPDGPGIGVEVNEKTLKRITVASQTLKAGQA